MIVTFKMKVTIMQTTRIVINFRKIRLLRGNH